MLRTRITIQVRTVHKVESIIRIVRMFVRLLRSAEDDTVVDERRASRGQVAARPLVEARAGDRAGGACAISSQRR